MGRPPAIAGAANSAATATPATKSFLTTRPTHSRCVLHTARDPRPASHWVTVEWPSQDASGEHQPKCAPLLPRCHSEGTGSHTKDRAPVEIKAALSARRLGGTADRTEAHLLTVLERAVRRPLRNETIWRGKTSRAAQP